jgi:prepilin-type N-terminal cleavage/methylation domain-containing protein
MRSPRNSGFTVVELLVVIAIMALLVGMLLPAIGKARDQARQTVSHTNLRNLATAHQSYAAAWSDRQFTLIIDTISSYGPNATDAFKAYWESNGADYVGAHPPVSLGWGYRQPPDSGYGHYQYPIQPSNSGNYYLPQPMVFTGVFGGFGAFRLPNVEQFNTYVGGRFYDEVFYAPNDTAVMASIGDTLDDPGSWSFQAEVRHDICGDIPAWSSYCLSPAAMFNPDVMRHDDPDDPTANGFVDPWSLDSGFRSPSFSQARYPNLKTHMLEHHWLQNVSADCNPGFNPGTYAGCEPYYFNHSWMSSPVTLFYDGHVGSVGVRDTMRADGRLRTQTQESNWGLWSRDTPLGLEGYFHSYGYDQAATSFHILTTDGIRGRDVVTN